MEPEQIYQPINKELNQVEQIIRYGLMANKYNSILKVNNYLLDTPGKRLRPALVILCTKASKKSSSTSYHLTRIAAAIELIHMASLIHDDVIDHASLRHNKPTINKRWGADVSIALGDYLYAEAFRLISDCGNSDIIRCISSATKTMCEGELLQVCERDNLDLLRQRYLVMVKKKTASLFACSCQAGAMLTNPTRLIQSALKEYGLNFGIAFQIVDDCLDLIGRQKDLGKTPGTDFKMGEITLPILNLLSYQKDKSRILSLIRQADKQKAFEQIRERFINSKAFLKTKEDTSFYIQKAKHSLTKLCDSYFKQGLSHLADYVIERLSI